ncbi:MAG: hypothetical protein HY739_02355 [Desulfobacterales bacterium]|nr:hypothetical protein [Desulfobacterales bacterium]
MGDSKNPKAGGLLTEQSNSDGQASKEFLGLKEFFSVLVKIISALIGFASLFVLLGYTIILSFINNIKLYGLTSFPQEFYKEATFKFMGDMFGTYGSHPFCLAVMIGVITITGVTIHLLHRYTRFFSIPALVKIEKISIIIFILMVILITLRLDKIPDSFYSIKETKKVIIFILSIPILTAIFVYLAVKFKDCVKKSYGSYYLMLLFFISLFISIPVGYGNHIFDIDIFPVVSFDCSDSTKIESLLKLKRDIDTQGEGAFFFLMGHTTDREIFFDNQSLSPPVKIILIERDLIKFLKISRGNKISLRNILGNSQETDPFRFRKAETKISNLPDDIKKIISNTLRKE